MRSRARGSSWLNVAMVTHSMNRYLIETMFLWLVLCLLVTRSNGETTTSSISSDYNNLQIPPTRTARALKLETYRSQSPAPSGANERGGGFLNRVFPVIQATSPNSLNSSVSFTIPLFSLSTNAKNFDLTSLGIPQGSSNLLVLLAVSTVVLGLGVIFAPPIITVLEAAVRQHNQATGAGGRASDGLASAFLGGGLSDLLFSFAENSLTSLPMPRLDPNECFKRCICEANNNPNKYGLVALPFQLFFPPYNGNQRDDDPSSLSPYQLAARYGKSDNANCGLQYSGCMFNPLDIIQTIINWFFKRSN